MMNPQGLTIQEELRRVFRDHWRAFAVGTIIGVAIMFVLFLVAVLGEFSKGDFFAFLQAFVAIAMAPLAIIGFVYAARQFVLARQQSEMAAQQFEIAAHEFRKSLAKPKVSLLVKNNTNRQAVGVNEIELIRPPATPGFHEPAIGDNNLTLLLENTGNLVARWFEVKIYFPRKFSASTLNLIGNFDGRLGAGKWFYRQSSPEDVWTYQNDGNTVLYLNSPIEILSVVPRVSEDIEYQEKYRMRYMIYNDWGDPEEGEFTITVVESQKPKADPPTSLY